jgi:hypothetical protein
MEEQIQGNLSPYVTSTFSLLPLTSTTSILSSIIGGVIKLPTAKFVDLIGRAEGFAIMTGFATLGTEETPRGRTSNALLISSQFTGLVMMAATRNVTTYAAAQVSTPCVFDNTADLYLGILLGWTQWHDVCSGCFHGRHL